MARAPSACILWCPKRPTNAAGTTTSKRSKTRSRSFGQRSSSTRLGLRHFRLRLPRRTRSASTRSLRPRASRATSPGKPTSARSRWAARRCATRSWCTPKKETRRATCSAGRSSGARSSSPLRRPSSSAATSPAWSPSTASTSTGPSRSARCSRGGGVAHSRGEGVNVHLTCPPPSITTGARIDHHARRAVRRAGAAGVRPRPRVGADVAAPDPRVEPQQLLLLRVRHRQPAAAPQIGLPDAAHRGGAPRESQAAVSAVQDDDDVSS
mmetsp:Transcript_17271/g.69461  ORF Transcript_17271/g.69461 Transcript_17271/m.69461 type:complete len:267 (-) Transcript_17271:102-902(-)